MARLPRLVVPNQPHHITQSGNDRQLVFRETADYLEFLARLREAARQFKVSIHAYVLMPDHLHLLATPVDQDGLSRMVQWLGRHYVPYFNRKYERSGTLWQGRYKATVVDAEGYLMTCCRYIETNPVRTGLVAAAGDYPWSSYPHHIGLKSDPIITDHPLYWALGNTPFEREAAYKAWIEQGLSAAEVAAVSDATMKGWALGSEQYKLSLEKQTQRRIRQVKRGRPARQNAESRTKSS
ncbi:transposase [Herminiimonas sp. KBW02]|uniref:REP-associated tyrosine transposase n=1 Tax=Herminiimonas sp. KBW02 TaxID=2153363 RepID=UPI000F5ABB45|nr:transposase [Herminiimonas sp. KBW02]RQO34675.1 transposase [Herminiimonas sp. KBW02]